jgi:predicted transcriptional regulator
MQMQAIDKENIAAKAQSATLILDHLVDALGSEPSCTLRRAMVFVDIDSHPNTTQADIMERLDAHKSALNRDIEWLYDYGCILRTPCEYDQRRIELKSCGYAKKNLNAALLYFDNNHKSLQNFLNSLINLFGQHKPTLRDAKIVSVIGLNEAMTRSDIFDSLYNGPATTDNRAVNNLINFGLVQKKEETK